MSKRKKFHNLIEQQDEESKQKAWKNISAQIDSLTSDDAMSESYNNGDALVMAKRRRVTIFGCALLILAIILSVSFYFILTRENKNLIEDPLRFDYAANEYSIHETDKTLKFYSEQNENKILYFNWYDETEMCLTSIGKLNTTSAIVCYVEMMIDPELGYSIQLGVTNSNTQVEHFKFYETCNKDAYIDNLNVKWTGDLFISYATFEYEGYCYYLEAQDLENPEDILNYVRELLAE